MLSVFYRNIDMKNNKLSNSFYKKVEESFNNFLEKSKNNPLLKDVDKLNKYYLSYTNFNYPIAIIPALKRDDPLSQSYYSCPSLDGVLNFSPVFSFNNTTIFNTYGKNLFEIDNGQPNFFKLDNQTNNVFTFDSERIYNYKDNQWNKSVFFNEYVNHILENPYVLFFKGSDDGHVGMRFKNETEAMELLKSLNYFEEIFEFSKDIEKELKLYKKGEKNIENILKNNLEYHN
jgi:hypothetical protein